MVHVSTMFCILKFLFKTIVTAKMKYTVHVAHIVQELYSLDTFERVSDVHLDFCCIHVIKEK